MGGLYSARFDQVHWLHPGCAGLLRACQGPSLGSTAQNWSSGVPGLFPSGDHLAVAQKWYHNGTLGKLNGAKDQTCVTLVEQLSHTRVAYASILGRMSTHVRSILMFTRGFPGFDPQPNRVAPNGLPWQMDTDLALQTPLRPKETQGTFQRPGSFRYPSATLARQVGTLRLGQLRERARASARVRARQTWPK